MRDPRRATGALLLRRAVDRGELPTDSDIEMSLDIVGDPQYWRLAVVHMDTDTQYYDRLADKLIAALRA